MNSNADSPEFPSGGISPVIVVFNGIKHRTGAKFHRKTPAMQEPVRVGMGYCGLLTYDDLPQFKSIDRKFDLP
jgi:hypothetical protein